MKSKTVSVPEAARTLGMCLEGVYRLLYAGRLEARKVEGKWRISEVAVQTKAKERNRHE